MEEDFPLIARDFYAHEFANIPEYEDVEYFDIQSGEDWRGYSPKYADWCDENDRGGKTALPLCFLY